MPSRTEQQRPARSVVRARDLGVSAKALARLGLAERIHRGVYVMTDADLTAHHSLAEVATVAPNGIMCLLTALDFHEIGTEMPYGVWMAIGPKARAPKIDFVSMRTFRFSGDALTFGVETHMIEGVPVHITSREKTVADCFKFRSKVSIPVAIEALREYLNSPHRSMDALGEASAICRVQNVMRPYVQALLA